MYDPGDVIDGKYIVEGVCSDAGGMGTLLFVDPIDNDFGCKPVLKYCKDTNEEFLKRFKREVRLLATFEGNSRCGPASGPEFKSRPSLLRNEVLSRWRPSSIYQRDSDVAS